ncbi:MAG: NUDIX domain-containing protein [Clostridium sp.]|nr:MAG: NUDIX domain-containing protein [Clostridium sp.]
MSNIIQLEIFLVAGYVNIGESLENAVKREIKEEVGLDVISLRFNKK